MRYFPLLFVLLVLALTGWAARDWARRHPEHLPWTPLDLAAPIGMATRDKLRALERDPAGCRRLLAAAGVMTRPPPDRVPPRRECATDAALRVTQVGAGLDPADLTLSCPMVAALVIWQRRVVAPAALRHFGAPPEAIGNIGSWNCRTIAGSTTLSEHARANALDVAAVTTRDGRRAAVLADWRRDDARGRFLREIRDGACQLFSVVLSPDHNAAHADHLHLDMGRARVCR
ncbi:hypothetical protein IP88_05445 [alpha proteobacterium AAP81b]|nr:hypothetical protein IP88_05445 [alpha proteobacterium AAP81b]